MKEVKDTYHTHLHSIDRKYFKTAKKTAAGNSQADVYRLFAAQNKFK